MVVPSLLDSLPRRGIGRLLRFAMGAGPVAAVAAGRWRDALFEVPFERSQGRNKLRSQAPIAEQRRSFAFTFLSVVEPKFEAGDTVYDHAHAAFFHSLHSSSYDGRFVSVVATGGGDAMLKARRVRLTMIAPINKTAA